MVKQLLELPRAFVKALGIVFLGFFSVIVVFTLSYLISSGVTWAIAGNNRVFGALVQFPVFAICLASFAVMAAMPKRIVEGVRGKSLSNKVKE